MGETADDSRTTSAGAGGTIDKPDEPDTRDATVDLRRVALAAYAAHLEKHARMRAAGAATPWGRAARIANLRRFDAR